MSLGHLAVAALAVAAWFLVWTLAVRRLSADLRPLRFRAELAEAVLLTAFAALWAASLGHGGWWLLFGVLGLLVEGPILLRHRADLPEHPAPWRAMLLGTVRFLSAGLILSLLL